MALVLAPALVPALLAGGCTDGPAVDDESASTSGIPPLDSGSGESSGGTSSGGTEPGTADDTSGGTGGVCETVLCGEAGTCCAADEECAAGACLPACASGVRCGEAQDVCCDAGQVCLAAECATPTGPCQDSFDCDFGEFCEPTLDQCLPQTDPVVCELEPEFEAIDATEEWAFTTDQGVGRDGKGVRENSQILERWRAATGLEVRDGRRLKSCLGSKFRLTQPLLLSRGAESRTKILGCRAGRDHDACV